MSKLINRTDAYICPECKKGSNNIYRYIVEQTTDTYEKSVQIDEDGTTDDDTEEIMEHNHEYETISVMYGCNRCNYEEEDIDVFINDDYDPNFDGVNYRMDDY